MIFCDYILLVGWNTFEVWLAGRRFACARSSESALDRRWVAGRTADRQPGTPYRKSHELDLTVTVHSAVQQPATSNNSLLYSVLKIAFPVYSISLRRFLECKSRHERISQLASRTRRKLSHLEGCHQSLVGAFLARIVHSRSSLAGMAVSYTHLTLPTKA